MKQESLSPDQACSVTGLQIVSVFVCHQKVTLTLLKQMLEVMNMIIDII
jgi:hypothetical protein